MIKPYDKARIWNPEFVNDLLQVLVTVIEAQDSYSQGHIKRVAEISLAIGAKMGLSKIELRDLYAGAILYDICKCVGAEKETLNKTMALDPCETAIIREHPFKAALLVVGQENLSHLLPTIMYHHERWDGRGYPAGLQDESIPLHARIIGVADAFDAMISPRSYRPALSVEEAIAVLQREKEQQFDPDIVDLLISCLEDTSTEWKDFSYYF